MKARHTNANDMMNEAKSSDSERSFEKIANRNRMERESIQTRSNRVIVVGVGGLYRQFSNE